MDALDILGCILAMMILTAMVSLFFGEDADDALDDEVMRRFEGQRQRERKGGE